MTRLTPQDGCAIVTGAGSGLGRALALGLDAQGFTVIALGRRMETLEATQALGANITPMALDVGDPQAVTTGFAKIRDTHGPIALLINNAAIYPHRDILDETGETFMATVNTNLGGVVSCSIAALDDMVARGKGRILNVATFADINPLPTASAYSVSKGAARIYTRAMIADLGDRFPDIVISDWMPGMLATGMGIPDGLQPQDAAKWGVELALRCTPDLTGSVFEMGTEVLPPRGLKGKIKDLVTFSRRKPRTL